MLETLRDMSLFRGFTEADMNFLLNSCTSVRKFAADEVIVTEGDRSNRDMYVLLEGELQTYLQGQAKKIVLNVFSNRVVFGEFMLLTAQEARTASISANSVASVLVFSSERLEQFFRDNPVLGVQFFRNLAGILCEKLAKTNVLLRHTIDFGW